jgi:hypothetical protein
MMDLEQNIECWKLNQRNIIVYLKLRVRELRFCLIRVQSNDMITHVTEGIGRKGTESRG